MNIDAQFLPFALRPATRDTAFNRDSIDSGYLHDIRRFELLERDQEYDLARRWRERGDHDAAHQLVASHLRLAAKISRAYRATVCPFRTLSPKATSA